MAESLVSRRAVRARAQSIARLATIAPSHGPNRRRRSNRSSRRIAARNASCAMSSAAGVIVDDQECGPVGAWPEAAEQRLEVGLGPGERAADERLLAPRPASAPAPQLAGYRGALARAPAGRPRRPPHLRPGALHTDVGGHGNPRPAPSAPAPAATASAARRPGQHDNCRASARPCRVARVIRASYVKVRPGETNCRVLQVVSRVSLLPPGRLAHASTSPTIRPIARHPSRISRPSRSRALPDLAPSQISRPPRSRALPDLAPSQISRPPRSRPSKRHASQRLTR